jgi:hypothetical protein
MTDRPIEHTEYTADRGSDLFTIAAVVCAAIVVTLFALHGAPNLLGDRFATSAITMQVR